MRAIDIAAAIAFLVSDHQLDEMSIHSDYDGPGQHRVCFHISAAPNGAGVDR